MFERYLRRLNNLVRIGGTHRRRRRILKHGVLGLEHLEHRRVLAPLAWSTGANLPLAEGGIAAQPEGTKLLTMAGPSTTSYALTPAYPSWQASATATVQPLDFARSSPGAGPLPNGYYLVFGGLENGFATSAVTQYDPNTVTVVDGASNQTRSVRSMNVPRAELGWATDATDLNYAIGGQDNNGTPLASMEVYNSTANSWTYLASLPQTLYGEAALSDGAGHIYTFGGVGANGAITTAVYRYTIATNTWDSTAAPMLAGVRDSAAVLAPNGLIYVIGGQTATGATATVESFNPGTNSWNLETPLPQPLSSAAAAVDSLGRMEVLGGTDINGNPLATVYVSQEFTQPDLAPSITSSPATAATLNGGYSYQVVSTANPQAVYSLTSAPAGMTIDSNTGLVNWTPTALGSYSVTVEAANADGQATQTFSINVVLPKPAAPTGLTGTGLSTTTVGLSWNASTDPYVTSYDIYREVITVYHSPRGSGGGQIISWPLVASGITGTSATLSQSGTYAVTAVNTEGLQSARSTPITLSVWSKPDLYVATTTSGADISSLTLNVGQTGQIDLIQTGANPAPTFSVVSGPSSVSVDPNSGLVTYTPVAADIGLQPVVFAATNGAGSSQYTFYFDVLALQPTIALSAGTFTYDGNQHGATATAFAVDGATPVDGTISYTYNGDPNPPSAAGTYSVQATFTSADPSYANAVATATLAINPATPTITVSGSSADYDGNPHAVTATVLGVDGVTPVDGSLQITYTGSPDSPTDPGLYSVVASFTSNDPNYTSTSVTSNFVINSPATQLPSLSLMDGSATYDGNAHADSATAIGTDGVTPVTGNFLFTYNGSSTAPTDAGIYTVVATFISSDINYADASISGTLTISQAAPTISFDTNTLVYDGTGQQVAVSALGVDQVTPVDGSLDVTYTDATGTAVTPVDAGTYTVNVTFTSNDPNYVSTTATSSLTISPATPSVGLGNGGQWEFSYTGLPQSVVGSAVGVDGVTPVDGSFSYAYYNEYGSNTQLFGPALPGAPTDAGSYTFIEYFTSNDPNYTDGSFSWYLTIYAAAPTLTYNGGPFAYNGSPQGGVVSAVGVDGVTPVAGSVSYATYNGSTTVPSAAGSYSVFAEFTSSDPNYYSSTIDGTLIINKATPAFSSLSSPAVNLGTTTVTLSGHLAAGSTAPGGDDVAVTLNGVTQPATVSSGGSFSTTFNIQGLSAGTYSISYLYLGDATRFNAAGTASGTLTVRMAPAIVTSPVSQTVVVGGGVTFTASASGYPTPTVQWQQSANGSNYTNISGATSTTYIITAAAASLNGYHYRAVFTNIAGTATTSAATLTVQSAPAVTTNPTSSTVTAGQTATFKAAASGNPTPTVQWQVSTGGGSFSNIAGATSTTLSVSATAVQNGSVYRAVFTNSVGSATTTSATLTVRFAPTVSASPSSQTVVAGQTATFSAAASGNPTPSIQWQVSTNGGTSFSNVSGATSATLTVKSTTAAQNGYQYRAVFTNSVGTATTAVATLSVQFGPTVTTSPTSQSTTAGQNVSFSAAASGNPAPSVQWQVSTDGGVTYSNISGATGTTLTLSSVSTSQSGYRYRAVFTNTIGSATSAAATLTVS